MGSRKRQQSAPSFVQGRKGRHSVVDCLVKALWKANFGSSREWPALTFGELRGQVSKMQRYQVTSSTIRSAVYAKLDLFERDVAQGEMLRWKLSKKARQGLDTGVSR